ncbi:hypothetical protein NEIELOOT_01103 [Neisseria elongata subsp. glycolytica ATCC 29315]|uniref:Uncharacterized protein n=1 Tax=Neisseria elongata subsp. glycolytica ATCC 29315 TaxID=546263 RepID=D4DPW6_NEIEG|nr:hypothetical protein NEIELOOT_01103 [Neisseria elongata subsp. glycolytica ATCC 29315]
MPPVCRLVSVYCLFHGIVFTNQLFRRPLPIVRPSEKTRRAQ